MKDKELADVKNISDDVIEKTENILDWINQPKEEARGFLLDIIKNDKELTLKQKSTLIYHSRKFTREYSNSKEIYEQAKTQFSEHTNEDGMDNDWLHFFFDKAEKVSNKSMQIIWSKMLAGEFNKPGSISRKLMHIISVMDVNSAKSFQTLCLYVFERYGFRTNYNSDALFIPSGFYTNSFEFMLNVEKWLSEDGYSNYKELALKLTMTTGELNSLENLGLIQMVPAMSCGVKLIYSLGNNQAAYFTPQEDDEIPLGTYSLTQEGEQLYKILNINGDKAIVTIMEEYLLSINKKILIDRYY